MNHNKIANQLGALFVAILATVLITVGFAPNAAQGGPRWASSSGGGGSVVPVATCSTPGGVIYASAGAFTCNTNFTTNGAGAVSASASVTSPIVQSAGNLSIRSGGASTDAATVANNLFTFNGATTVGSGTTTSAGLVIDYLGISGYGALYPTGVTRNTTNFALATNGTDTILNAPSGSVKIGVANANQLTYNGTSLTGANNTVSLGVSGGAFSGLAGTNTNNSAAAGFVGEYITSSVATSGAVVISSNTPTTVVSTGATVTAGDYDAQGLLCYISGAATSFTVYKQGINTTTNAFGALGTYTSQQFAAMTPLATTTSENCQLTPLVRVSLSGTSNVFMVAAPIFSVSGTITAYGFIRLRRVR